MTSDEALEALEDVCSLAPVIPVITIERIEDALPLANALIAGGLPALEVTLRTDAALEAINIMSQIEGAVVGAGTVLNMQSVLAAKKAGALFAVSPGATHGLIAACEGEELPLLAGASTPSDAMALAEIGYTLQKFFPAEANGGVDTLKAFAGPLPHIRFCPTGGVGPKNVRTYLELPNVVCVGGSWVVAKQLVDDGNWDEIKRLARAASLL